MVTEFCVQARRHRPLANVQIPPAQAWAWPSCSLSRGQPGEQNASAEYVDLWVRFMMFGRASDVLTRSNVRAASVRSGEPCARVYAENL
jgi:hypothetical protein